MVDTPELIVIDTAETRDELCRKEREQIETHQSCNKEYGYNGTRGGDGIVGYEHTEEEKRSDAAKEQWEDPKARQRVSDAMKEHWEGRTARRQKASDATKKRNKKRNYKPFDVFSKDGTYIESFDNQCEALEYLQGSVSQSGVSGALRGERKSSGGFVFKYRE